MHAKRKLNTTLYQRHIRDYVNYAIEIGEYAMTISQFAKFAHLKVTHNLRRRLRELFFEGVIVLGTNYEDFGTLEHVIIFPNKQGQDVPF